MVESLFKVGTSAGGRRPKAVVNVNFGEGQCYSGQVATPYPGYTPMIVKFDEHQKMPTTRIEYSYYLMAVDAGLQMMPSRLLEGEQTAHFLTERFDRRNGKKVHIQTLAAMNPPADLTKHYSSGLPYRRAAGGTPATVSLDGAERAGRETSMTITRISAS